jgi:hypothetical protein
VQLLGTMDRRHRKFSGASAEQWRLFCHDKVQDLTWFQILLSVIMDVFNQRDKLRWRPSISLIRCIPKPSIDRLQKGVSERGFCMHARHALLWLF